MTSELLVIKSAYCGKYCTCSWKQ